MYMHVLLTLQCSFENRSMPTSSLCLYLKVLFKPCCVGKIKETLIFRQCLMIFLETIVAKGWLLLKTEL